MVRIQAEARDFSLLQLVQTGSGIHSASYKLGTGISFTGGKVIEV
jgi:hypothetical protein